MGLGKTVMTIALILSNPSRAAPDDDDADVDAWNESERSLNRNSPRVKGGTLIVCPMALLGQWKVSQSSDGTLIHLFLPDFTGQG